MILRMKSHSLASKYFYPDRAYNSIEELDLKALYESGIRGLISDIDNTLIAPGAKMPDRRMTDWIAAAREIGFDICLLSNAARRRVTRLSSGFGVYAIAMAGKPTQKGFLKALRLLKLEPAQACVIGDQIFTDILGAKLAGMMAIHIKPITKREIFTVFMKRFVEYFIMKGYYKSVGA